ncbi:hypothetical protein [Acidisphaera sp. L21]|uniref:hypothetical protein n=1 Tax=Acidisphaera sp. L21 TaxID=1641851 RepID=UPI00131B4BF1|nr:hypothetical protein [Acidisphaera sp. L21]
MHEAEIARLEAEIGALQDQEERYIRIEQMQTNIEKMRADMKQSNRTFTIQAITAAVALLSFGLAAGTAIGHFWSK